MAVDRRGRQDSSNISCAVMQVKIAREHRTEREKIVATIAIT